MLGHLLVPKESPLQEPIIRSRMKFAFKEYDAWQKEWSKARQGHALCGSWNHAQICHKDDDDTVELKDLVMILMLTLRH